MKRILQFSLSIFICSATNAQVIEDSISLAAGYTNQSFYSLKDGEKANITNSDWDIAFDASSFGSAIHTNGQAGVELYVYPKGDTNDWGSIDTNGLAGWSVQHNSDLSWNFGAFDISADPGDPSDLGWGIYNIITHAVTGDSLFIIRSASGEWKKLWIKELAAGKYHFKYADLNGSNETVVALDKSKYKGKNFGYYSLNDGKELDREPNNDSWDLVFTKYITGLGPGVYYGVTGVLQNNKVQAAKAYPVNDPYTYKAYGSHNLVDTINKIGYDWKYFDMGSFMYIIEDSTCYFVKDVPGNVWRITFTGFGGSSTGNVYFSKELIAEVGVAEHEVASFFEFFPNPAKENINLVYGIPSGKAMLYITSITGKQVMELPIAGNSFGNQQISIEGLDSGIYFIALVSGQNKLTKKLIVQ